MADAVALVEAAAADRMQERAARGDSAAALAILDRVPDVPDED